MIYAVIDADCCDTSGDVRDSEPILMLTSI